MSFLDFLSDVGRVASPGLEAYGQGRVNVASLLENRKTAIQKLLLELEKVAEQKRQFGVTSGLAGEKFAYEKEAPKRFIEEQQRELQVLYDTYGPEGIQKIFSQPPEVKMGGITFNKKPSELDQLLSPSPSSSPKTGGFWNNLWSKPAEASSYSPNLEALGIKTKPGGGAKASQGISTVPATTPTSPLTPEMPVEEFVQKALLEKDATPEVIIKAVKENYDLSDTDIKSSFSSLFNIKEAPTIPGPGIGGVGYGPLTQGNPQGGLASLSGSPIDFQRYFPPKEEILPRLRQIPTYLQRFAENRRGGPFDIQQYIPRTRFLGSQ